MNFLEAMETPIVWGSLKFLRLDMDDCAAMLAEHVEPKLAQRKAIILADPQFRQNPVARSQALADLDAERDKADMVYLLSRADNPKWIGKFLSRSLIKAGSCHTNEEAAELIRASLHFSEQRGLAIEVLSPPRLEDSPSFQGAAGAGSDTAATTSPTSPSLENGAESSPAD